MKRKIIYQADATEIVNKIKKIIKEARKINGKIIKIEVPFETAHLKYEIQGIGRTKTIREARIKRVVGIDIIPNATKLQIIREK